MDAGAALQLVARVRRGRALTLVGIGGFGCAGKTTLARMIPQAQIISTDEFWDGERFDLDRVRAEVLEPFARGEAARFQSFDWVAQRARGKRLVPAQGLVVVEGVCALHRTLRDAYDLRLWVDAPRAVRLARALAREGDDARAAWEERWLPSEERYARADDPVSCADLVIAG
jgi:uridine kinase